MPGRRGAAAAAGFAAGLCGGLFGVGGGIVMVPVLTRHFGLDQHRAHGTSLGAVGATALAGLAVYAAHGRVAWAAAVPIAVASVPAARWGARLAARARRETLLRAFALVTAAVALRLLWRVPAAAAASPAAPLAIAASLALGGAVGLLAGFLGVGGGLLIVPALTLLFHVPQATAQGTSLALILVTAPVGAFEHDRHGNVDRALLPALAAGAALGSAPAAQLAHLLPQAWLARGFAVFLLVSAAGMWRRSRRRVEPAPR